jgi:hypothetical protein
MQTRGMYVPGGDCGFWQGTSSLATCCGCRQPHPRWSRGRSDLRKPQGRVHGRGRRWVNGTPCSVKLEPPDGLIFKQL